MKYKEAKKIVENSFNDDYYLVQFGWKFRLYPCLRKQIKQWAKEVLEGEV